MRLACVAARRTVLLAFATGSIHEFWAVGLPSFQSTGHFAMCHGDGYLLSEGRHSLEEGENLPDFTRRRSHTLSLRSNIPRPEIACCRCVRS